MISEGLHTLKNMAHDMNEVIFLTISVLGLCIHFHLFLSVGFLVVTLQGSTRTLNMHFMQELDRQVPLMDEIDTKVRLSEVTSLSL